MSDRSGVLGTSQVTEPQWRKLRPLLDHALDLEGDERVDYLAEVNQNHPELGAALARMLGRASNNHLLDRPLHELADGLPLVAQASPLNDRAASLVGSQLGPYRLLDLLGRGGMGAVFKAASQTGVSPIWYWNTSPANPYSTRPSASTHRCSFDCNG